MDFCLRIACTWVIAYCVYLSHWLLYVPESLRIVCTWVIAYFVYLSHCLLCVPESLRIVCTWVIAYLCTWVTVYVRRQKSFNKRRSEQSVILFSTKISHTFSSFSDNETKVTHCNLLDEKSNTLHFLGWLKEEADSCSKTTEQKLVMHQNRCELNT